MPLFRGIVVCSEHADAVINALAARSRVNMMSGIRCGRPETVSEPGPQTGRNEHKGRATSKHQEADQRRAAVAVAGALRDWRTISARLLSFLAHPPPADRDTEPAAAREMITILVRLERALTEASGRDGRRDRSPPPARSQHQNHGTCRGSWAAVRQHMMQACGPGSFAPCSASSLQSPFAISYFYLPSPWPFLLHWSSCIVLKPLRFPRRRTHEQILRYLSTLDKQALDTSSRPDAGSVRAAPAGHNDLLMCGLWFA